MCGVLVKTKHNCFSIWFQASEKTSLEWLQGQSEQLIQSLALPKAVSDTQKVSDMSKQMFRQHSSCLCGTGATNPHSVASYNVQPCHCTWMGTGELIFWAVKYRSQRLINYDWQGSGYQLFIVHYTALTEILEMTDSVVFEPPLKLRDLEERWRSNSLAGPKNFKRMILSIWSRKVSTLWCSSSPPEILKSWLQVRVA